jgi:predicted transcriptional regulator
MTVLQLELPEALTERLREVADERNLSLDKAVVEVLEDYFDGEDEMEDTPNEKILRDIKESFRDALAGRTRPIEELLAELDDEMVANANTD